MTSVLMMTVIGACTIYAAEEGGSAEVNVQTKVSGTAPEKEVFTYTLKEQGASDNQERKLTVEGAGTGKRPPDLLQGTGPTHGTDRVPDSAGHQLLRRLRTSGVRV